MVISRYALDYKPYNTANYGVTWETCTLRTWLNQDFLNAAFSSTEQAMIPTVTVTADKNPSRWSTADLGNATQDKVFLLSIVEANEYFVTDSARKCNHTAYANAQKGGMAGNEQSQWWLRTPGDKQLWAAYVGYKGKVSESGMEVISTYYAVRPALWIELAE